jgi:hypothetical protein
LASFTVKLKRSSDGLAYALDCRLNVYGFFVPSVWSEETYRNVDEPERRHTCWTA